VSLGRLGGGRRRRVVAIGAAAEDADAGDDRDGDEGEEELPDRAPAPPELDLGGGDGAGPVDVVEEDDRYVLVALTGGAAQPHCHTPSS
jgi:hypothetical protein